MSWSGRAVDIESRRAIDVGLGVLIGWYGCTQQEAFDRLADAVHQSGVGIGTIAAGLVALANGVGCEGGPGVVAARMFWGDVMLAHRAAVSQHSSS